MSSLLRNRSIPRPRTEVILILVFEASLLLASSCSPVPTATAVAVPVVTSPIANINAVPSPVQSAPLQTAAPTATLALLPNTPFTAPLLTPTEQPFPPAGCGIQGITGLIDKFLDGLNKDDPVEIGQAIALDDFEEFFVGGTKAGKTYIEIRTASKAELLAYIALRHARHEVRKQLEPARLFPDANRTNSVAIAFYASRKADDIPLMQAGGKGAVYCGGPRIVRWIWDGNQYQ